MYYQFSVPSSAFEISVEGGATATGHGNYYLKVYIMDSVNFFSWKNGQNVSTYYRAEEETRVPIATILPPGKSYYLVVDNTFSTTSQTVELQATLTYSQTRF